MRTSNLKYTYIYIYLFIIRKYTIESMVLFKKLIKYQLY